MPYNLIKRVAHRNIKHDNSIPLRVEEASVDEQIPFNKEAVNIYDVSPHKVQRTVKNTRYVVATDAFLHGIIMDVITKANSEFQIVGDNPKAVEHIKEMAKEWKLSEFIDETIEKGLVDGEDYLYHWFENGHLKFRYLFYDGEDYRIKETYDDNGEVMGYKQLMRKNTNTNKGWRRKLFKELKNDTEEEFEQNFELEEIIPIKFNPKDGRGRSQVMTVLDLVYLRRSIIHMMPLAIYKNSNIFKVTMGNKEQPGLKLHKDDREKIINAVNNYHEKGAVVLPYGIEAEMIQGGSLPDMPSYLKYLESLIYIGMNTPEATFSSESSNRATADIQLDSPTTGRVLYFDYIRDWINRILDKIFRLELDENGFSNAEVWIEFKTNDTETVDTEDNDDTNHTDEDDKTLTEKKPIQKKGEDYTVRDTVSKQNTSGTDKIGGQIGGNGSTK